MLRTAPWKRLPLTVRWLRQEHELLFPLDKQPPVHMPIAYGQIDPIASKTDGKSEKKGGVEVGEMKEEDVICCICHEVITGIINYGTGIVSSEPQIVLL